MGKKKQQPQAPKCPATGCKIRLGDDNKFACAKCGKSFCKLHLYPNDHDCQPKQAPVATISVAKSSKPAGLVVVAKKNAATAAAPAAKKGEAPETVLASFKSSTPADVLSSLESASPSKWDSVPLLYVLGAATKPSDVDQAVGLLNGALAQAPRAGVAEWIERLPLAFLQAGFESANKSISDESLIRLGGRVLRASTSLLLGGANGEGLREGQIANWEATVKEALNVTGAPELQAGAALFLGALVHQRVAIAGGVQGEEKPLIEGLVAQLLVSDADAPRRFVAHQLAAYVYGYGVNTLESLGVMDALITAIKSKSKKNTTACEAGLVQLDVFCRVLETHFVPFFVKFDLIKQCVTLAAKGAPVCRPLANALCRSFINVMDGRAVVCVVPELLDLVDDTAWKIKEVALHLLGALSKRCVPKLSLFLPAAVPKVMDCVMDTKKEVSRAAIETLDEMGSVVTNPETMKLLPWLLDALKKPETIDACLDELMDMTFVNSIEAQSLALIIPVVTRGMKEGSADMKQKACTTAGNVCALVKNVDDMRPFAKFLLPELEKCLEHSRPRVRELAENAKKSLLADVGDMENEVKASAKDQKEIEAELKDIFSKAFAARPLDPSTIDYCVNIVEDMYDELLHGSHRYTVSEIEEKVAENTGTLFDLSLESNDQRTELFAAIGKTVIEHLMRVRSQSFLNTGTHDYIVDLKDIILAFPSRVLLQVTDLTLERGKRYAFVGQNGVGKTTLLNRIAAKDINGFPESCRTYYVQHEIMEEDKALTVMGYMQREVTLGAAAETDQEAEANGSKAKTSDADIIEALNGVGFSDKMRAGAVANLSGGWRMRLAIARSMLYNADLLLLDEPTNHLDLAAIHWLEEYLCSLKTTTIGVVSHDYDFLTVVSTDIIHIHDLKLSYYEGGFKEFQRQRPDIVAGLPKPSRNTGGENDGTDAAASALDRLAMVDGAEAPADAPPTMEIKPIKFPVPGKLEGISSRGKSVMTMTDVQFSYPGTEKVILHNLNVKLNLNSRVALLGPNGAGKSTLLKLLVGEQEVNTESGDVGKVWTHHNLRTAYIAQHSMHHLEDSIELTPCQYIQRRFYHGRDKEMSKMMTLSLTPDEEAMLTQRGEVCKIHSRVQRGKKLYYEIEKVGRRQDANKQKDYRSTDELERMNKPHVIKLMRMFDEELKAVASGMDIRPLTTEEMISHLEEFGIPKDLAQRKIRWMSGGQKSRLVLAAAMWTKPHLIALDEPTNYLDNETLAALTHALKTFKGGVITVSHNEAFVDALCKELWHVENGQATVEVLAHKKKNNKAKAAK